MKNLIVFTALIATAVAACGKKDKDGGSSGGGGGGAVDPAKANAAIPASWKGKVEFEAKKLGKGKFGDPVMVAAPKGWKDGFMDGSLEPPDGNKDFGFGTTFRAGGTCEGECKKEKSEAEWVAAGNASFFGNLLKHDPAPKIIKDEKGPGHRTLVATDKSNGIDKVTIVVAKWKDGGDRLYFCTVDLADASKEAAPAFEQACETVVAAN
jgi:hypothetical protein